MHRPTRTLPPPWLTRLRHRAGVLARSGWPSIGVRGLAQRAARVALGTLGLWAASGAWAPAWSLSAPFALPLDHSPPASTAPAIPASASGAGAAVPAATPTARPSSASAAPAVGRNAAPSSRRLLAPFASLDWAQLSTAQRSALAPLAQAWPGLTDAHRRKWISLSENWLRLGPDQQRKLQARMTQWAALTPRQRETARLMYAEVANLPAATKQAQWQAYQALSADEKQKLRKEQPRLTPRTAIAPKPTTADKLQRLPTAAPGQSKLDPRIVWTTPGVRPPASPRKSSPSTNPSASLSANASARPAASAPAPAGPASPTSAGTPASAAGPAAAGASAGPAAPSAAQPASTPAS